MDTQEVVVNEERMAAGDRIAAYLEAMAKQDNRCTAAPYFYQIEDQEEYHAPLDNCEEIRYYDPEDCESNYKSTKEFREHFEECGLGEDEMQKRIDNLVQYGISRRTVYTNLFFTETDAENHLRCNKHHYSSSARTYVRYASRAHELTEFLKDLFSYFGVDQGNYKL